MPVPQSTEHCDHDESDQTQAYMQVDGGVHVLVMTVAGGRDEQRDESTGTVLTVDMQLLRMVWSPSHVHEVHTDDDDQL